MYIYIYTYIIVYMYIVCRSESKVVSSTKDQEVLPNRFPNCGQIVLLLLANPSDVHLAKSFPRFSFPLCGYQIFQMFKTLQLIDTRYSVGITL